MNKTSSYVASAFLVLVGVSVLTWSWQPLLCAFVLIVVGQLYHDAWLRKKLGEWVPRRLYSEPLWTAEEVHARLPERVSSSIRESVVHSVE
jgi:hypothetical protein